VKIEHTHYRRRQLLWGLMLVAIGMLFLLERLDMLAIDGLWHYWPVLTAIFGIVKLMPPTSSRHILGGLWLMFFSAWWYVSYEHLWGLSFHDSWPFLLIAWGAGLVLEPLLQKYLTSNEEHGHER
jgi:hypothetical protein